jgi:membrane protease YdiL (CAAX protease family)
MSTIVNDTQSVSISPLRSSIVRHPLLAYFLIAFLGTWLMVLPLVLSQEGSGLFPIKLPEVVSLLIFIGSAYTGPALAALIVTAIESGRPGVRQLLRRVVQWRVGIQWYFVALFSFLSIWLVAYSLVYRGASLINLIQNWQLLFSVFLPNVILGIFIPSLGEEPGWRGFALPRLQTSYGPLLGTAILGLLHSLWHLPAFFTPLLGPFTPAGFLAFVLTGIAGTTIYTWVFNHTRASILIAIIIHASSNAANQLLVEVIPTEAPLSPWVQALVADGWLNVIAFGTVAGLLILLTRGRLAYADSFSTKATAV